MEKICRIFIYFILFLVLYQYFNKVVEGHNVQSTADCSSTRTYAECRSKAPSCYWRNLDGKRTSEESGSCASTGSTVSPSRYHSGNHHASDHNHPIDPSIGQITGRVEGSGENQVILSITERCDTHTCPDNYVKRDGIDNTPQGDNATQSCCRPVTCDTFECGEISESITDPSPESVNQFDPPDAPTELPQARCCTPKMCNTYNTPCPTGFQSKSNLESLQQGNNPNESCCEIIPICNTHTCPTGYRSKAGIGDVEQGNNPNESCCEIKRCSNYGYTDGVCQGKTLNNEFFDVVENPYRAAYPNREVDPDIRTNTGKDRRCCVPKYSKDLKCGTFRCPIIKYGGNRAIAMKRNPEEINRSRGRTPVEDCCIWDWGPGSPYSGEMIKSKYYSTSTSSFVRSLDRGWARIRMGLASEDKGVRSCAGYGRHKYPRDHTKDQLWPTPANSTGPNGCMEEMRQGLNSTSRDPVGDRV